MERKAQSQIITTVLIILLVLAAIVIVWQVVQGSIKKSSEGIEGSTACMSVELEITKAEVATGPVSTLAVTRKAGGEGTVDIRVLVKGAVKTPDWDVDLSPLESTGDSTAYTFGVDQKVEVAAILSDGTVCNALESTTAVRV